MAAPVLILLGVGIFLRVSLFGTSIAEWFAGRNEVTTSITSWNRGLIGFVFSLSTGNGLDFVFNSSFKN